MNRKLAVTPQFIVSCLLCLLPILVGLTVYGRLPDPMPSHWSFSGEVNDYSAKAFVIFGIPLLMAAVNAFVWFALSGDPRKTGVTRQLRNMAGWLIPLFTLLLQTVTIAFALGYPISPAVVVPLVIGSLFILIGSYLPKCKQNYAMAIKNPWTLHSPEIWRRTHRLAGRLWVAAGFLLALNTFVGSRWLYIGLIAVVACVPYAYSYALWRKGL